MKRKSWLMCILIQSSIKMERVELIFSEDSCSIFFKADRGVNILNIIVEKAKR